MIWYIVVLAIGLAVLYRRRTQPIAMSLLSVYARDRRGHRRRQEPGWRRMSRNKKILIGVGRASSSSAAVAFANVKFKRQDGVAVNVEAVQKRDLRRSSSASGKIQPQRLGQHQRRHDGPGDRPRASRKAQRVQEGGVPAADRSAQPARRLSTRRQASLAGGALADGAAARRRSRATRTNLKRRRTTARASSELWKQGLTTKESARERARTRSRCARRT